MVIVIVLQYDGCKGEAKWHIKGYFTKSARDKEFVGLVGGE